MIDLRKAKPVPVSAAEAIRRMSSELDENSGLTIEEVSEATGVQAKSIAHAAKDIGAIRWFMVDGKKKQLIVNPKFNPDWVRHDG